MKYYYRTKQNNTSNFYQKKFYKVNEKIQIWVAYVFIQFYKFPSGEDGIEKRFIQFIPFKIPFITNDDSP